MTLPRIGVRTCLPLAAFLVLSACTQSGVGKLEQSKFLEFAKNRAQASCQYKVFFDHLSDGLSDRAKQILGEASASWNKDRIYNLKIIGHTDTFEVGPHGRGLGKRRTAAVKAFLIQAGLPERMMVEYDLAAAQPLVRTMPNTPDPQNQFVGFHADVRGSIERDVNKFECLYWLRKSFCAPLANRRDMDACNNALSYF